MHWHTEMRYSRRMGVVKRLTGLHPAHSTVVGDDPYPFDALLCGACLLEEATPNFQRLRLSVVVSGPQTLRIFALSAWGGAG